MRFIHFIGSAAALSGHGEHLTSLVGSYLRENSIRGTGRF